MHNEAHKIAANLMGSKPEYCRLDAVVRQNLIADITAALANAANVDRSMIKYYQPIEGTKRDESSNS